MPVNAITSYYVGEVRDKVENYNGNQLVYVCWDYHLLFCSPFAFLASPEMTFKSFINEMMDEPFGEHNEYSQINWKKVEWLLNGEPFIPQMDVSLISQGVDHKAMLRFQTPELKGFQNAHI